jgi:5-methylcytosine-specific restriction endonuclease McrA
MRIALISMYRAVQLFGKENVYFQKPSYVPPGSCPYCGNIVTDSRRTYCSNDCRSDYANIVYWGRGRGAYSTCILYRDNFTCQICGCFHAYKNEHGLYLPSSDGHLEVHHKIYVCNGGDDSPQNLIALCDKCHDEVHRNKMALED